MWKSVNTVFNILYNILYNIDTQSILIDGLGFWLKIDLNLSAARACPYLDNEAKNRLNRQQNKANCADNIGILSNNLTQFCQI